MDTTIRGHRQNGSRAYVDIGTMVRGHRHSGQRHNGSWASARLFVGTGTTVRAQHNGGIGTLVGTRGPRFRVALGFKA